jgi:hypothetical protein
MSVAVVALVVPITTRLTSPRPTSQGPELPRLDVIRLSHLCLAELADDDIAGLVPKWQVQRVVLADLRHASILAFL